MKSILALLGLCCSCTLLGQLNLSFTPLDSTFVKPLELISAGDDSQEIYIAGKDGPVHRYDLATKSKTLFLDVSDRLETLGEAGVVGATFHPDPDSNYFYLYYTVPTTRAGAVLTLQLSRFTIGKDRLPDLDSEVIILAIDKPGYAQNGGGLAFGPDGYLYIGTGDGGGRNDEYDNAQDPNSLLGKILRIDVDRKEAGKEYAAPVDNPFVTTIDARPEVWSLGLRNPFGISFDPETGDLYIGDKANSYWQEINLQKAGNAGGQNYGWNCMEGFEEFSPASTRFCGDDLTAYATPLFAYGRDNDPNVLGGSVTAGRVYRGPAEALQGMYVFGDFFTPRLFVMDPSKPSIDSIQAIDAGPLKNLTTLGTANDGTLFAVDYNGSVYRVEVAEPVGLKNPKVATLAVFPNPAVSAVAITWTSITGGRVNASLQSGDGRVLRQWRHEATAGSNQLSFDLHGMPSGLYTLRLHNGKQVAVGKFTVR